MRGLSTRRIASTALCAALLAGISAPAAMAADSTLGHRHAVSRAPVTGTDAQLARVKSPGNLGGSFTPITNLLNTELKADNGQLTAAQATRLVSATKQAVARVTPQAAATPQAKDAMSDALAALQNALDALQKAVTSGDADQVATAVNGVVTALTNYLTVTPLGNGLPTSTLPGLPTSTLSTT
jgi:hypothetical protein